MTGQPRRLRLCIVTGGHWSAQAGGAEYQAKCLADILKTRDDLELYYLAHVVPQQREREGYRIIHVGPGNAGGSLNVLASLPSLYLALKRLRPDVVYQRSLMAYTGVCAMYCARHGARFVFHMASDARWRVSRRSSIGGLLQALSMSLAHYGLKRADVLIAQSEDQAQFLRERCGLRVAAVVPNFHPPPEPAEPAPARTPGRARVIWVANMKPVKNPEVFVELAEAFVERSDVEFVMIGRGAGLPQYRSLFERMARLPNLHYRGELPIERVNREIAASDILVNTSSYEGFPNTFIQAWLRNVPVVSCWVDPDGCLSRKGAGVLVGDRAKLAPVIAELLADPAKLKALGSAGRAYAQANHQLERAQSLVDLLIGCAPVREAG